jgi:DNA-binding LacI/PurR family transcriptional regulator
MSKRTPTSIDVAELAGVSQPTVSRAFDPDSSVAPGTRARVIAAAKKLGYKPNVIARSLSTRRTDIVGLVMANLTDSLFYPNVLEMFTRRLQRMGKQVLLFNAQPGQPVDEILPRVLGYQVDALIITSTSPSREIVDECARNGTPVVLFNRFAAGSSANSVCCDNVEGGRKVADALLDTGHKRLGFIAGIENTSTNLMRTKGFVDRLQERGDFDLARDQGAYTYDSGRQAARRLLERDQPPDAIFCAADIMALGAMDAARFDLGIKVPEDLSIIGFDDIPVAGWPAYSLTTIRQPIDLMVDAALQLVTKEDDRISTGELRLLPGALILRDSLRTRR